MIGRRAGNAAEHFVVVEAREDLLQIAERAAPVRVERRLDDRVRQDRGGPLDGVDLGHQRRIDQPRLLEQPLVVPDRVVPRSMSQIALCSSAKSPCSRLRPTHEFSVKPVISRPVTARTKPAVGPTRTLPSRPVRSPPARLWCSRRPASRPTSGCSRLRRRADVSSSAPSAYRPALRAPASAVRAMCRRRRSGCRACWSRRPSCGRTSRAPGTGSTPRRAR